MEKLVGEGVGFERIRRVTGYLSGDVKRFNNGKRAEEKDRVKHTGIKEVIALVLISGGIFIVQKVGGAKRPNRKNKFDGGSYEY